MIYMADSVDSGGGNTREDVSAYYLAKFLSRIA